ncbi:MULTISPECIES: aminodeoxychorismate lyase [Rossellomorea]|jgi:4-amino-4-deoxychorismate lyase|uniref:aminodeoxychorismate lyase n=1 Tax=Rossellomorea TaxID=2837508 RepID=UPI0011E8F842|nr:MULTISPECIES: aminodeoxychorismate lyase [Rossellomorea]MDT9027746.1 aminodeoxychorismate lyase [Rossellomorea sp. YC4-1]TYS83898.1 aminodeoxychorismate lyase [Rossellomorea aquimaris]
MYLYLNGKIVHASEAVISPFDHGYLYGLGVFETFRTYEGHPFLLKDHLKRLSHGLKELNIASDLDEEKIRNAITTLLNKNGLKDAYCRFNISGGVGEIGLQTTPYEDATVILFQKELPPSLPLKEKEGVLLQLRRNTPETGERLKSHHYLNNMAAKREIGPSPHREGIFLTKEGHLCEGITSNLFWVKDAELYTPAVETGLLNGITRQFILALADRIKMPVREGMFGKEQLLDAHEVFFTNSVQEIIPVNKIDSVNFPGRNGEYSRLFYEQYSKYTGQLNSIEELEQGESCNEVREIRT